MKNNNLIFSKHMLDGLPRESYLFGHYTFISWLFVTDKFLYDFRHVECHEHTVHCNHKIMSGSTKSKLELWFLRSFNHLHSFNTALVSVLTWMSNQTWAQSRHGCSSRSGCPSLWHVCLSRTVHPDMGGHSLLGVHPVLWIPMFEIGQHTRVLFLSDTPNTFRY